MKPQLEGNRDRSCRASTHQLAAIVKLHQHVRRDRRLRAACLHQKKIYSQGGSRGGAPEGETRGGKPKGG